MKNYKKGNAGFVPRIFTIALVTVLTATTLWAKPKNAVEYTPFKSENPNATVFECELIPGCDERLYLYCNTRDANWNKAIELSSVALYGWKKKKGGWEKLGEYQSKELAEDHGRWSGKTVLDDDCDKYTHYAVEFEAPENTMTLSAKKDNYNMHMSLRLSEEYKKMLSEKRATERAEQERLEAEEEAKKNAEIAAKAKQIAKGYVFHGIDEAEQNCKYFLAGALEDGHAYYIPWFVVRSTGLMGAVAYDKAFLYGRRSSYVLVEYASLKVKADVIDKGISFGVERLLEVVVIAGKAPFYHPVILGVVQ